jgi:hypothetical protein
MCSEIIRVQQQAIEKIECQAANWVASCKLSYLMCQDTLDKNEWLHENRQNFSRLVCFLI